MSHREVDNIVYGDYEGYTPPAGHSSSLKDTRPPAPAQDTTTATQADTINDMYAKLSLKTEKKAEGSKLPLEDSAQHMDITKPGSLVMTEADLPFQPFSAALSNVQETEKSLLSPAAAVTGDRRMMDAQQVSSQTSDLNLHNCSFPCF
jgi:hypothetical protein